MSRRLTFPSRDQRQPAWRRALLRLMRALISGVLVLALVLVAMDIWISWTSGNRIHSQIRTLPEARVAVILGTSKYHADGINPYYQARIDSIVQLYESGRIERILASGDNLTPWYNEPEMITEDLIQRGIPAQVIEQDGAGSRTLYSIRRLRSEYGIERVIVVSQSFHLARALFQARAAGLDAWGYAAETPGFNWYWRVRLREVVARAVSILEVVLLGRAS